MRAPESRLGLVLIITGIVSVTNGFYWHGVAFVAKHGYGFDAARTQVLYAALGLLYAALAFASGRISRSAERALSPRAQLVTLGLIGAAATAVPIVWSEEIALWISAAAVTGMTALLFPILESYLSRGRHGPELRAAVHQFNVVWMIAVASPLFFVGAALGSSTELSFVVVALVTLTVAGLSAGLAATPAEPDPEAHATHVTDVYPALLRAARTMLPLSYLFLAALSPIVPYRLDSIGVTLGWATPLAATWMLARVVAVVVLRRFAGWHGRYSPLVIGVVGLCGGIATVLWAPSLPALLVGFVAFGLGAGTVYAVAIYYAMAIGHGDVDAGSVHEGLIGLGYAAGPTLALASGDAETLTVALSAVAAFGLLVGAQIVSRARR